MLSQRDIETRKEMISDARSMMSLIHKMESAEQEDLDAFTGAIQSVIDILDPQSYRLKKGADRSFHFQIDKFINAEKAIARATQVSKKKLRFWRKSLIHVLGLKYQDPELIYLIILKYSSAYWDSYSEHTQNAYNIRDILLFTTIGMESEASLAFRDFMKTDVSKSFFKDMNRIKQFKKKSEVAVI